MSALTVMATLLQDEIERRGFIAPSVFECEDVLRHVIDRASAVAGKPVERRPEVERPQ